MEGSDYVVWPAAVWELFGRWYGGGPAFPRAVKARRSGAAPELELYPLSLRVCGCDEATGRPLPRRRVERYGLGSEEVEGAGAACIGRRFWAGHALRRSGRDRSLPLDS